LKNIFIAFLLFLSVNVFAQTSSNWLKDLPDSISIADINLPGSHDAAAINKHKRTPYACHNTTIPQQLDEGIRILDIRIKIKGHSPDYSFVTCHGKAFGGAFKFNEYQSLLSVLDECAALLKNNPTEFIAMMIKIDDWNGKDKTDMYKALDSLLFSSETRFPIYNTADSTLPTLGRVRGKIYLVNRIDNSHEFGVPVAFPNNKADIVAPVKNLRTYPIYIQDQFEKLGHPAEKMKFDLFKQTIDKKKKGDGTVVLNYATARKIFMFLKKVYIQDSVLNYFGSNRPLAFGWTMFDYENREFKTDKYDDLDVVKIIISSNFQYKYPEKFKILMPFLVYP